MFLYDGDNTMYCVTVKFSKIKLRRPSQKRGVGRWKRKKEIKTEDNNIDDRKNYINGWSGWSGILKWSFKENQDGKDHKY